jgi:two-component system, NarL family, sensor histidine kinase DegS
MDNQSFLQEHNSENIVENLQNELDQTKASIKEINTTFDQSQNELNRLTQKKANVTAQLQQVQIDPEKQSRINIRDVFTTAMDAQQRLLVMRAQLDRLQEQLNGLIRYKKLLEYILEVLSNGNQSGTGKNQNSQSSSTLEMLVNTQEAERQRLSRQMHDGPAQALSNFIVQCEIVSRMFDIDTVKSKEELEKLKNSSMNTFQKVRAYIDDLRPMMLDDLGLVPTLKRYLMNIKEQTGMEVSNSITGADQKLDSFMEIFVFRAVQELVGNAVKHNQENASKLKIEVNLSLDSQEVKVLIKDNGKGFDTNSLNETGGIGLKLLQERVAMLGGSINIKSTQDKGTEVILQIPVAEVPANK